MDPFRLSLLLIGVIVIALIYLIGRWRKRQAERDYLILEDVPPAQDDAPMPGGPDEWDIIPLPRHAERGMPMEDAHLKELAGFNGKAERRGLSPEEEAAAFRALHVDAAEPAPAASKATPPEELFVLSVIAQEGDAFTGPTLSDLFEQLGLSYGDMRIFHRLEPRSGEAVFSVVNIIEPGYFDLEQLPDLRTPGLALFMRLPGPVAGAAAFDDFLGTARGLAGALEGRLADQQRRPLNDEMVKQMRGKAQRYPTQP